MIGIEIIKYFFVSSRIMFLILCFTLNNLVFISLSLAEGQIQTTTKEVIRFTPHITAEARTRDKGKFSFQRAVGANLGLWVLQTRSVNLKTKTTTLKQGDVDVGINAIQILFNYFPQNSRYKFGFNLNSVSTSLLGLNENEDEFEVGNIAEYGFDASYMVNDIFDLTLGLGWLRETGFSALEEVYYGFGLSLRWYRPGLFFSSPTGGFHYTPETGAIEFLFSTTIY